MDSARLGLVHLGSKTQCPRAARIAMFKPADLLVEAINEESAEAKVCVREFGFVGKLVNFFLLLLSQYDRYLARKYVLVGTPGAFGFGVICHDLQLLPLVLHQFPHSRIVFDAREYYPLQFEHSLLWRLTAGRLNSYICRQYMVKADLCVTVSRGIADAYMDSFDVPMTVVQSFAIPFDLVPGPAGTPIRLVHHGNATPNRSIENMIELLDLLGDGYTLDLYLVPKEKRYYRKLQKLAAQHNAVQLHHPIPFAEIVPTLNRYDIGLFIPPAATFNLKHSMPNKLFEFLQARLMVVVGSLEDAADFVNHWGIGLVAKGSLRDLADQIRELSNNEVTQYKERSAQLSPKLNAKVAVSELLTKIGDLPNN